MGSEEEQESRDETTTPSTTPTLQLFSLPLPPLRSSSSHSPEHSGTLSPPLHTLASVPFKWEEHPGKPLPCTTLALVAPPSTTTLELPPRLLNEAKFTKTPSPTTVLEGPYNSSQVGRSILESSSFRCLRKRQGSFDGAASFGGGSRGSSPDRGLLSAMVVSNGNGKRENKGLFGSWRKKGTWSLKSGKSEGGSFVFSSFSDDGTVSCDGGGATTVQVARMNRKRSLLGLSHAKPHFWATIYGAFKQVIPRRRSAKWSKDAS